MPPVLTGGQWSGTSFIDAYRRNRNPTPNEILAELKNTAWTCASLNASVCASYPPRLYVRTQTNQARPKCLTEIAAGRDGKAPALRRRTCPSTPSRPSASKKSPTIRCSTCWCKSIRFMNAFDLWELTTLYQEVHGAAYWLLDLGPLGTPQQIWILPSQNVTPRCASRNSRNLVDYYLYRTGTQEQRFRPDQIIHFRYPDPRDPVHRRPLAAAGLLRAGGVDQRVCRVQKGEVREPRHPRRHRVAGRGDRRGGARPPGNAVEQSISQRRQR